MYTVWWYICSVLFPPPWKVSRYSRWSSYYGFTFLPCSVQFGRSVVSDSLRPHESQHARPPCPSLTPGVHSNSCPSVRWCHPAISSSVVPFSSCPQSVQASGSLPMSQLYMRWPKYWSFSFSIILPMNTQDWSPLGWTGWISLQSKEIQPVHSKGDQPWMFFGRNDTKAETPVLGPPHAKSWLTGKDADGGRDWGQEEKGMTEFEMAGWHHRLNGLEFEWTPGVGDGQGGLAYCGSWGSQRVRHDWATELNWIELNFSSWSPLSPSSLSLLYVTLWTSLSVPGCQEHIGNWLLARLLSPLLIPPFIFLVTSTSFLHLLFSM